MNLSLPAAAKEWGVSGRTAYRLAEAGLIRVARFGRRITVTPEEVARVARDGVSEPVADSFPPALALPKRGRRKQS